jgi:deoxyribodipyrimidine photo-lyase
VGDNTALHAACSGTDSGVVGLYLITPEEWRAHDLSANQVDLRLRCVRELSASLARLNIPLLVVRVPTSADVARTVVRVAKEHACDRVHFNREYEIDERRRDEAVVAACAKAGIVAEGHTDQSLLEPGEVRTGEGAWYTVFTPFKKACIARMKERGVPGMVPVPKKQAKLKLEPSEVPAAVAGFGAKVEASRWPAGEEHAAGALRRFRERGMGGYKERRDFPGDEEGTSRLSAYLAVGAISPRQCLHAAMEANAGSASPLDAGNQGATTWISEVLWREFYMHIMVGFPRVCMHRAFQPATERLRWSEREDHFEAWAAGRTGIPIVDAGMRQLLATGWMHNRVRMITAMFLTKNLFIDWRRGERHFMLNLVDGFLACNNGGWQWSASTGTDAAPYFRIFNPVSQSQKFDPEGTYIRRWVPELAGVRGEAIHEPWSLPVFSRSRLEYPEPIVDLSASRRRAIEAFQALRGT